MGANEDHFSYAMKLVTTTSSTMVLVNAIKLKIFDAIAKSGPDAKLSAHEIASCLSIHNKDAPDMLDHMLRLLASHSIVTCTQQQRESRSVRVYGLAPVAKYFIPDDDGASLAAYLELDNDKLYLDSWLVLKDSILEGGIPFEKAHGTNIYKSIASDTRFNDVFNNAMMNHTTIVMREILECYHGFDHLKSVVDVGGGHGISLNMIISKHPTINGINFDLPNVTLHAPKYPRDMFEEVPEGDAIFMKWILHNWSDDLCAKLLKNCYNALPNDGKVIVIDAILPFLPNTSYSVQGNYHMDVTMMTQVSAGGKERTEDEFLALSKSAGFSGIKKVCVVCNMWIMEFYK